MTHPFKWVQKQTKVRPFLSALVIIIIIVAPGFAQLESAVTKANDTAHEVETISQNQRDQAKATTLGNCQTRNNAQKNGRERFNQLFNAIDVILTSNPNTTPEQQQATHAFVESLRRAVPLDAGVEDVDCNADGSLTIADYG